MTITELRGAIEQYQEEFITKHPRYTNVTNLMNAMFKDPEYRKLHKAWQAAVAATAERY